MDNTFRDRLRSIGIFSTAIRESGAEDLLLSTLAPRNFGAGTVVFEEGADGAEMFVLHRGRVRISKKTPNGDSYTVVLLDEGHNAFFGEVGLLESERRSATVTAETDVECLVMSRDAFVRLGDEHPVIGLLITREIAKSLSQRLRKANKDMITLFTALVTEIEGEVVSGQSGEWSGA
jgi:CRP-like cAMP-binding protein